MDVAFGSKRDMANSLRHFRSAPQSKRSLTRLARQLRANYRLMQFSPNDQSDQGARCYRGVPFAQAQAVILQPSASLRSATVNTAPDCVTSLPRTLNFDGCGNDNVGTVAGDIVVQWLGESDEIIRSTMLLTLNQNISVPILRRCWPLPDVRGHPVKDRRRDSESCCHRRRITLVEGIDVDLRTLLPLDRQPLRSSMAVAFARLPGHLRVSG